MPELPEVETVRRDLEEALEGAVIRDVDVLGRTSVVGPEKVFLRALAGAGFTTFGRRGKLLLFGLHLKAGKDVTLAVHLRMTGQLIHVPLRAQHVAPLHQINSLTRVILHVDDGSIILFNDQRRFGRLEILDDAGLKRVLAKFGPEPLEDSFTRDVLAPLLKRRRALKAILLDQQSLAGVGNIYADEILFRAGLAPRRLGSSLKGREVGALHAAIVSVLQEAVRHRGTSFSDYLDGKGGKGTHEQHLKVYGREGQPCRICKAEIQLFVCAGRSTRHCKKCQKSR